MVFVRNVLDQILPAPKGKKSQGMCNAQSMGHVYLSVPTTMTVLRQTARIATKILTRVHCAVKMRTAVEMKYAITVRTEQNQGDVWSVLMIPCVQRVLCAMRKQTCVQCAQTTVIAPSSHQYAVNHEEHVFNATIPMAIVLV